MSKVKILMRSAGNVELGIVLEKLPSQMAIAATSGGVGIATPPMRKPKIVDGMVVFESPDADIDWVCGSFFICPEFAPYIKENWGYDWDEIRKNFL